MIDPFAPATLGPITLRNRIIKAATFEGATPHGAITQRLLDYHLAPARGGVGMTTLAYCAIAPEGRTDRHQILLRPEIVPELAALVDALHATGAKVSAQLGHAGPVANAASNRAPALAPSRLFSPLGMRFARSPDATRLAQIVRQYAAAARVAEQAGIDAVELHFGHNYLVSAFFSPLLNRRTDAYGGSLAHRARLAREVAAAVADAVGGRIAVIAKLNMDDGVSRGLHVEESLQIGRWLQDDGHLDALVLTAGSSLLNPMYLFRGGAPRREFADAFPPPMRWGLRVGGRFLREYPYEETYLLDSARAFRRELSMPLVLLGGISSRASIDKAMAEGFAFVEMGRALLREPDLLERLRSDPAGVGACIHCNRCMPTIYSGTHCPVIAELA